MPQSRRLLALPCLVVCLAACGASTPSATTTPKVDLDLALQTDDVEAICRAAGASRCQRLDTQKESRSVEIYADESDVDPS